MQIIDALRRGTVPQSSLDAFAVGLDRFEPALDEELRKVAAGGSVFKAVRGEYGCGKTFFARWLADRAKQAGLRHRRGPDLRDRDAAAPAGDRLPPADGTALDGRHAARGALRNIVDGWFYALEEDVLAEGSIDPDDAAELLEAHERAAGAAAREGQPDTPHVQRGPARLPAGPVSRRRADIAEGILAWLAGQPNVAAAAKRLAGVKGDIDHFGALSFLQGLLTILRDSGHVGLARRPR